MAVYVFNLLVNWVNNGVDNAQGYRASILKEFQPDVRYIFIELPGKREIELYKKVGIDIEQMLSMHQYFTNNHALKVSVSVNDKLQELKKGLQYTSLEYRDGEIRLIKEGSVVASILLEKNNNACFYRIYYFEHGKLFREENYTDGISYVNHYVTANSYNGPYAKLVRRTFCNVDGTAVYDQMFEGNKEWYIFLDGRVYTTTELIAEFIKKLNLTEQDTVLLDRSAQFDFVQPLFRFGKEARIIAVMHSGHYFDKNEDPDNIYLNREYNYWFKYSNLIDTMVVSTEEQKEELIKRLYAYHCCIPDVRVIPAGGIEYLRYPDGKRKSCSLIAVSRIHPRKKIEWIIKSVINAYHKNPNISLDIYGGINDDSYFQDLQNIVKVNHAQSYIRFMGYMNVSEIYKNYEVFITASLWETLGLSMLEAIGSGTAVIGLDVKYGNRLFVHSEENGYLVDFDLNYVSQSDRELINNMAEKIIEIFADEERLQEFHENSYKIGQAFLNENNSKRWKELLG
ncbi:glycosyltransferase [Schaedlerella arabinosiphila]|uniref:glycosyltransferase n=1 Tax=Schaedlerella arabinosiphila TaxID=2044587 RepID=UPI0002CA5E8B|nr:glycosyltransferase [Schaedlerella arabinosiphila]KAI4443223.1 UDP-N-acetylglucosamine--peptide N-acetylglucosaminyltransferase GtfA subunit [Schaedlerella arabinosiphila]